jgi:methionyl-tRNA formyltransferase
MVVGTPPPPPSAGQGVNQLRSPCDLNPNARPKMRVAVFGSFMGGYHVLKELMFGEFAQRVIVTGVATDDPTQPFKHPNVRLWKYSHTRDDELLVNRFAEEQRLPVFTGKVRTPEFHEMFSNEWQPELCLMATFGQKIPNALISFPRLGFYNFHHSSDDWPSYPGPDLIAAMVRDGRKHLVLTIHKVTDVIDGGEFVAHSHPVAIPAGINAVGMHRITWPQMGRFICREVGAMLDASNRVPVSAPLLLQEETVANHTVNHREWPRQRAA